MSFRRFINSSRFSASICDWNQNFLKIILGEAMNREILFGISRYDIFLIRPSQFPSETLIFYNQPLHKVPENGHDVGSTFFD
jgi:hypothetical protein